MTEFTKSYTLSKVQQLIDLNHDAINFRLKFTVQSQDAEQSYQMVVVNQSQLDSGDEIQYKDVQGTISGEVVNDNNVYQNYYMILRSQNAISVDVSILLDQLPEYIEQEPSVPVKETEPSTTLPYDTIKKGIAFVAVAVIIYYLVSKYGNPLKTLTKGGEGSGGGASLLTKLKEMPVE
jgi:hypothetical protein